MARSSSIKMKAVPLFFHKLSSMLVSGIPLEAALIDLERQSGKPAFKDIVRNLRNSTERGKPLSESMKSFPDVFLPMHTGVIQAAETAGKLPEALEQIAASIDDQARLRRKILRATIYPFIILGVALVVVSVMLIFVLPVFKTMYDGFDAELPRPTQYLLAIRDAVLQYGLFIVVGLGAFALALKIWKSTLLGSVVTDWARLHYPVFGDLNRKIAAARFARTYAQLLSNGAPIVSALKLAARATGNSITEQVILNAVPRVEKGEPLSSAIQDQNAFPDMLRDMLQSGEKTGKTDEMLENLARLYEEEASTTADALAILLQPFLIVILGIIVGGMLIAILMPWLQMPSVIDI